MSSDGGSDSDNSIGNMIASRIKRVAQGIQNSDIGNEVGDFATRAAGNTLNLGTMGYAGFDSGGLTFTDRPQGIFQFPGEVINELTGRNKTREQLYQKGLLADEQARRNQLLADERAKQAAMDRAASEAGAGAQRGNRTFIGRGGVPLIMGDVAQGDLLGL